MIKQKFEVWDIKKKKFLKNVYKAMVGELFDMYITLDGRVLVRELVNGNIEHRELENVKLIRCKVGNGMKYIFQVWQVWELSGDEFLMGTYLKKERANEEKEKMNEKQSGYYEFVIKKEEVKE